MYDEENLGVAAGWVMNGGITFQGESLDTELTAD